LSRSGKRIGWGYRLQSICSGVSGNSKDSLNRGRESINNVLYSRSFGDRWVNPGQQFFIEYNPAVILSMDFVVVSTWPYQIPGISPREVVG
jgi:hypothetical protein